MTVTDIQRFSLHDGPGIRTTVFLQGCNLRCKWCHNPEALLPEPRMQFFADRCIGCGACVTDCPQQAHKITEGDRQFDRALCVACGSCVNYCYPRALVPTSRTVTVEEVLREILADKKFYQRSGGGATLSGGEPLFQLEFAVQILRACKSNGIHTAIETNLAWDWSRMAAVVPLTDLFMVDIKMMDASDHQRFTGASNEQILANVRKLSTEHVPMIVRTPVVVGANATADQIGRIADFICPFENLLYYELLPYNPLGMGKYAALGMHRPNKEFTSPDPDTMRDLSSQARTRGIDVRAGGNHTNRRDAK